MNLSDYSKNQNFFNFAKVILVVSFLILFTRLFELQIIKGSYYKNLSDQNRVRDIVIRAPRGRILARGGEVITDSELQEYFVNFTEKGIEKTPSVEEENDLDKDKDKIEEYARVYKEGSTTAHVTGYVGEVNSEELGKIKGSCPDKGVMFLGDFVGRSGLEEEYDCTLRGENGDELIEVDAAGKMVRVLGRKLPIQGSDVKSNLDINLQRKVAQVMADKTGSVIVTDKNGEVLSFYSSPSYDPNVLSRGIDKTKITEILNSPEKPIFNRVIGGIYHPGSTFKTIVALGALEENVIDKDFLYEDRGYINIKSAYGDFNFKNWYFTQYGRTEGEINVSRALTRSTDTFFYNLGELMGVDKIRDWVGIFGMDKKTGIDLPGEVFGLIPDPVWKMREKGERWFLGDTYNISIGQGDLAVTPASIHRAVLAIANRGQLCDLSLVGRKECSSLEVNRDNLNIVREGMFGACSSGGTGYTFFDFSEKNGGKIKVGCKTGTAETSESDELTHAWFTAFSESENSMDKNSDVVVTVLVEKGGEGSSVAGPVAREIFDYWFGLNKK